MSQNEIPNQDPDKKNEADLNAKVDKPSLEEATQDWAPDPDYQAHSEDGSDDSSGKPSDDVVTMIEDPLGSPNLSIQSAQNDHEFVLDQILDDVPFDDQDLRSEDESDDALDAVAGAIAKDQASFETEQKEIVDASSEPSAEDELARQIAEDDEVEAMNRADSETGDEGDDDFEAVEWTPEEVQARIETLLYLSDRPLSTKKLQEMLQCDKEQIVNAIEALKELAQDPRRGIEPIESNGGWQFQTKVAVADTARLLSKVQAHRLSRGAMETLAVAAYRQPVMKEDIDKVRGVDSSHFIRGLMEKNLLQISGRSELPGRPILYTTTDHFLQVFGLAQLDDLPPLQELEKMIPSSENSEADEDAPENLDPNVKKMRSLVHQMKEAANALAYDPKEDEEFLQEIRERVKSIEITTPTLDDKKEAEGKGGKKSKKSQASDEEAAQMELTDAESYPGSDDQGENVSESSAPDDSGSELRDETPSILSADASDEEAAILEEQDRDPDLPLGTIAAPEGEKHLDDEGISH